MKLKQQHWNRFRKLSMPKPTSSLDNMDLQQWKKGWANLRSRRQVESFGKHDTRATSWSCRRCRLHFVFLPFSQRFGISQQHRKTNIDQSCYRHGNFVVSLLSSISRIWCSMFRLIISHRSFKMLKDEHVQMKERSCRAQVGWPTTAWISEQGFHSIYWAWSPHHFQPAFTKLRKPWERSCSSGGRWAFPNQNVLIDAGTAITYILFLLKINIWEEISPGLQMRFRKRWINLPIKLPLVDSSAYFQKVEKHEGKPFGRSAKRHLFEIEKQLKFSPKRYERSSGYLNSGFYILSQILNADVWCILNLTLIGLNQIYRFNSTKIILLYQSLLIFREMIFWWIRHKIDEEKDFQFYNSTFNVGLVSCENEISKIKAFDNTNEPVMTLLTALKCLFRIHQWFGLKCKPLSWFAILNTKNLYWISERRKIESDANMKMRLTLPRNMLKLFRSRRSLGSKKQCCAVNQKATH